jgi:hypothetical protein
MLDRRHAMTANQEGLLMTRIIPSLTILAALLAQNLVAAPAQAQLARTFVSSNGSDAADCSRLAPCRTFQVAHDNTLTNGEITVLDPGGYGAVTITKAISIINDGVGEAGTLVSGGLNGITVSAGAADAVTLRGLTIKGIGFGGGNGIRFNTGKSLKVENCVIRNLDGGAGVGLGLLFQPGASSSLFVSNTVVADNAGIGILVQTIVAGISATAVLNRVEVHNNGADGVNFNAQSTSTITAAIEDSVFAKNTAFGVYTNSVVAGTSLMLARSVMAHNGTGFAAAAGATVRIGQSVVTGNTTSWSAFTTGIVRSYGNNFIDGNGDGGAAPLTIPVK